MKIAVLGDGAWGSALAMNLARNGHEVIVWGAFPDYIEKLQKERVNSRFLPGVEYPDGVTFTADAADTAAAGVWVLATPTQFLRPVLQKFKNIFALDSGRIVVDIAKGIEDGTWLRIGEMVADEWGEVANYVTLSGPSHAEEVSRSMPTAVVVASKSTSACETVRDLFMNSTFRVYTSDDVVGLELGGALKNVMAIAAGIIDGMQLGDNPKAALMTRGIAEMGRLGAALGGRAETFAGLSGIGDLIVTCTSRHSRNRFVGEELGKGRKIEDITAGMGMVVAEGVRTCRGAYELSVRAGVETPIIQQMYRILYEGQSPEQAIEELMNRNARPELD